MSWPLTHHSYCIGVFDACLLINARHIIWPPWCFPHSLDHSCVIWSKFWPPSPLTTYESRYETGITRKLFAIRPTSVELLARFVLPHGFNATTTVGTLSDWCEDFVVDKLGISTTVIRTPITEFIVRGKGLSVNAFPEVALTKYRSHRYRKSESLSSVKRILYFRNITVKGCVWALYCAWFLAAYFWSLKFRASVSSGAWSNVYALKPFNEAST